MRLYSQLLICFSILILCTLGVGLVGFFSAQSLGALTVAMYDKPLMTINYARSAAAKAINLDRQLASGSVSKDAITKQIDDIQADILIVAKRGGKAAAELIGAAQEKLEQWTSDIAKDTATHGKKGAMDVDKALQNLVDFAEEIRVSVS